MNLPKLPQERRQRLLLIGLGVALLVGAWLASAAGSVSRGRSQALAGLNRLEAVREGFEIESLNSGELTAELSAAAAEFASAQSSLRAPWVTPFRIVPWAGTQIRSADALSGSAATVARTLADATDEVLAVKDATQASTINKAQASAQLLELTRDTRTTLDGLELGPATGLVGTLADARFRFEQELVDVNLILSDAEIALDGMTEFLTGPTTYLLLSANTAEMRAGSGRFLLAGPLEVRNGDIEVGELSIPQGAFRAVIDLGKTPRFDVTATNATIFWENASGQEIDGVLVLDPVALQSVLVSGETLAVDGLILEPTEVLSYILFDQYWEEDRDVRKDRQKDLAEEALSVALGPEVDLVELVRSVRSAAVGRHILAWSKSAAQQAAWEVAGVDGIIAEDSLMVSLLNRGQSKLDTFIDVSVTGGSGPIEGGTRVRLIVDVANNVAPGFPSYVIGPFTDFSLEFGGYAGTLIATLPAAAHDFEFQGAPAEVTVEPDGPVQQVSFDFDVAAAASVQYTIDFTLPAGLETVTVEPSARLPKVAWNINGAEWFDVAPRSLDLVTGDYGAPPTEPVPSLEGLGTRALVPPTPVVEPNGALQALVTWRALPADAEFVLWQKVGSGDWFILDPAAPASGSRNVQLEEGAGQPCFRTSLIGSDTAFSTADCLSS